MSRSTGRAAGRPLDQPADGSLELHTRLGDVSLFAVFATLGAPLEASNADLAIEAFPPADAESAVWLREP